MCLLYIYTIRVPLRPKVVIPSTWLTSQLPNERWSSNGLIIPSGGGAEISLFHYVGLGPASTVYQEKNIRNVRQTPKIFEILAYFVMTSLHPPPPPPPHTHKRTPPPQKKKKKKKKKNKQKKQKTKNKTSLRIYENIRVPPPHP